MRYVDKKKERERKKERMIENEKGTLNIQVNYLNISTKWGEKRGW